MNCPCEPVEITPNGPMQLNLSLRDLAKLSGRTMALDESPIPSVVVQALPVGGDSEDRTNWEPGLQAELLPVGLQWPRLRGFPPADRPEQSPTTRAHGPAD